MAVQPFLKVLCVSVRVCESVSVFAFHVCPCAFMTMPHLITFASTDRLIDLLVLLRVD